MPLAFVRQHKAVMSNYVLTAVSEPTNEMALISGCSQMNLTAAIKEKYSTGINNIYLSSITIIRYR